MATGAQRQAAYRNRRSEEIERLRARVEELELFHGKGHAACDAKIADLQKPRCDLGCSICVNLGPLAGATPTF